MGSSKDLRKQLLIIIIFFMVISIVFIYSSSFTTGIKKFSNAQYFLYRQIIWYFIGFVAMVLTSKVGYKNIQKYRAYLFIGGVLALIAVLFLGIEINGSKRWFRLGPLSVQPAEFAKLFFIIWFAGFLDRLRKKEAEDLAILIPSILMLGIYATLIVLERDLSTALHLCAVVFVMLIASKIRFVYIFGVSFIGLSLMALLIFNSGMRANRVTQYVEGMRKEGVGGGYQVVQSVIGIGNGGFIGAGYGKGLQKYFYIPELHTDFIFAVIAEELGFLMGSLPIISLYVWFMIVGFGIAKKSSCDYGKYLALGISSLVVLQALINLMVVSGMIPATGIPLPFVSSGGSSIASLMMAMGILFNISKKGEK